MPKPDIILRSKKKKARDLFQQHRLAEARDLYQQICQLDRRDAESWFTLGLLHGMSGQIEEAIACNREAVALRPDYAEAHFNLAKAQQTMRRLQDAEQAYRRALVLKPQWPEAWNNLGNVHQEAGRLQEAGDCYRRALDAHREYPEALVNLGNILRQRGESAEAVACYRRALHLRPDCAPAYKFLGSAYIALGQLEQALDSYRHAARLDPADIGMVAAQAAVLERQGKADQAYVMIEPYVDDGSANLEMANVLAALCDKVGRCEEAATLLEQGLNDTGVARERRSVAHFNLGRLYDRAQDYDKAFHHFKAGNDLKPQDFDGAEFTRFVDAIIETFDADFMANAPRAQHGSQRPIFIIGMPRSGTSLVEQILASHPQVFGGGELEDIKEIAFETSAAVGTSPAYPQSTRALTAESCEVLASRYLAKLQTLSPDAQRITDKMPQNFLALGLIALLFPEARLIHCTREPLDTCLSCYCHDFSGYHPYVYRLESLGQYYRQYRRLMDHWQAALSIPMLKVSYESLVEDPERGTRELLAFCGLEWDDRCLRFYECDRVAHTASYQQVRKPIYRSSLERWRHYAAYLAPLRRALEA